MTNRAVAEQFLLWRNRPLADGTDGSIFDFRKVARRAGALDRLVLLFYESVRRFCDSDFFREAAPAAFFGSARNLFPMRRSLVHRKPFYSVNLPRRCFIF